jgi:hypothetical protein
MSRVLTAAVALSAAFATAQERTPPAVELRHCFRNGDTFAWALEIDAAMHQDRVPDTRLRFVLHFAATVALGKSDLAEIAHRVARLEAHVDSRMAKVDFDSDRPHDDPGPLKQLAGLVGKTFVVAVEPGGRIDHVTPPAGLEPGVKDDLGGGEYETLFNPWFVALPKDKVAPGDRWESTLKLLDTQFAGGGEVAVVDRLEQQDGDRAVIARTFKLPPTPQRPGLRFQVQQADGRVLFDRSRGRVIESSFVLRADVSGKTGNGTSRVAVSARAEPPAPFPGPFPGPPPLPKDPAPSKDPAPGAREPLK